MAGFLTDAIGQGTTDLFVPVRRIAGLGVHLGDASNTNATANLTPVVGDEVRAGWDHYITGFATENVRRSIPIYEFTYPSWMPRKSQILRAMLKLRAYAPRAFNGNDGGTSDWTKWPSGSGARFDFHAIRLTGLTSADWVTSDGATPWTNTYGPHEGDDYVSTPTATSFMTSAQAQTWVDGTEWPMDITTEAQFCIKADQPIRLIMPTKQIISNGWFRIDFDNPADATYLNSLHTYLEVDWRPSLSFHKSLTTAGRPIDMLGMLDPSSADFELHIWLDAIDAGSTSPWIKFHVRSNTPGGTRRRVVVEGATAWISSIDNSDATSGVILRGIDLYDNATGNLTPSGALRIIPDSGDLTKFKVYLTPVGASEVLLTEETTGNTSHLFTTDHVLMYGGKRAFLFRKERWVGTLASILVTDVWRATSRADQRPDAYSVETLEMTYLAPHQSGDEDAVESTMRRVASRAYSQQIYAATETVDIGGGTMRTKVPLQSAQRALAGDWITLTNESCTVIRQAQVHQVHAHDHATPSLRDSLILTTELDVIFPIRSYITNGVSLNNLISTSEPVLSTALATGDLNLNVTAALPEGTTQVTVVNLDIEDELEVTVGAPSGLAYPILSSIPIGTSYPALTTYVIPVESLSSEPFFVQGDVPATTDLGRYLGYLRAYEIVLV